MRAPPTAIVWFVLCLGVAGPTYAGSADLDSTFATNGSLIVPFGGGDSAAEDVVLQADGRIVAVGWAGLDVAVVRTQPDGSLDPSFGTGGIVTTDFAGAADAARAVALQPDGMIVVAGSSNPGTIALALARYQADGTLDPGFGSGGLVIGPSGMNGRDLVLRSDGKLIAGGFGSGASGVMLARYDAAGVLDPTFGVAGVASTGFADSSDERVLLEAIALQPDGKIVAVGGGGSVIALARFEPDGSIDSTFGVGGKVTTDVYFGGYAPSSRAYDVLVQPDGKLVLGGVSTAMADVGDGGALRIGSGLMLRYDSGGALDPTFNGTGIVHLFPVYVYAPAIEVRTVARQLDDRLVGVGSYYSRKRVEGDGTVDASFSSTQHHFGIANALVVQPDLKLVAAGASPVGSNVEFEIVRFGSGDCGDGTVDPSEDCDDGNPVNGDGCDVNCTPTACGNNIVTTGEDCEPGIQACCTASCSFAGAGTACVGYGSICSRSQCDGDGTCANVFIPSPTCVAPPPKRSSLQLTKLGDLGTRKIVWTWQKGPVELADLDDPIATPYTLCVYDHTGGASDLALVAYLGNPFCPSCWKTTTKGYEFKQNDPVNGSSRITLRASSTSTGTFKLKATRQFLSPQIPLPLSVDPRVTVQLRNEAGDCWGADFTVPTKNDGTTFKAKSN